MALLLSLNSGLGGVISIPYQQASNEAILALQWYVLELDNLAQQKEHPHGFHFSINLK